MAKRYELSDAAWDLVADPFMESRRNGGLAQMIA
jgi:hypothetical protein